MKAVAGRSPVFFNPSIAFCRQSTDFLCHTVLSPPYIVSPVSVLRSCSSPISSNCSRGITTVSAAASSSVVADVDADAVDLSKGLKELYKGCKSWKWNGYDINFIVRTSDLNPDSPPLLLVHGFGASVGHWRRYAYISKSSQFRSLNWSKFQTMIHILSNLGKKN